MRPSNEILAGSIPPSPSRGGRRYTPGVAELFGLVFSLILLLVVLLPILSFLRLGRISRELQELTDRVQRLERETSPAAPVASEAPAAPVFAGLRSRATDLWGTGAPAAPAAPAASASARTDSQASYGETAPQRPEGREGGPVAPVAPDLETRIGGRGLLYTGVLVLLLGVSFFLKYAFDNAWVNETGRVVLGALAGLALIGVGLRLATRGLRVFGHALAGTGLAILYLAIYAALNFYALIEPVLAFVFMVIVTLGAAAFADRQRSQALALIAVGGGFLTPFLVGGGQNAQLTLFTYDALLVVGTLLLAVRHQWLGLNALSYLLTLFTLVAWAGRYYDDDLWLRTLLFLTLFCVLFLIILRETARAPGLVARLITLLLATGPVFYHLAAVLITAEEPPAIHVYLIAFTAAGLWLTAEPHRSWLRLLVLLAGFAPLFGTLTLPNGLSWIVPNLVTIVAVAALHTLALFDRIGRQRERLETADLLALHLTGLGLFALLYRALQPAYPDFRGALAALIALGAIGLWQWWQTRDRLASLNAAALAFTLAALGVAVQFDGPAAVIGWAAEGAGAVWMGARAPSVPFQYGGLLLWALAALRLSEDYFETPANFVALFNARSLSTLFVVALGYVMAWLLGRHALEKLVRPWTTVHIATSFLSLMWITAEIQSFWDVRLNMPQAYLYKQMMLSLAWGIYGAALIVFGMRWGHALARYVGMTVLAVTVLKVFLYDLWELGGIYRVCGFIGFGVLLVLVSYLYQRRKSDEPFQSPPPPPPSPPPPSQPPESPLESQPDSPPP